MKYSIIYSALLTAALTACSSGGSNGNVNINGKDNNNVSQQTDTVMPSTSTNQVSSKNNQSKKILNSEKHQQYIPPDSKTEVNKKDELKPKSYPSTKNDEAINLVQEKEEKEKENKNAPEVKKTDKTDIKLDAVQEKNDKISPITIPQVPDKNETKTESVTEPKIEIEAENKPQIDPVVVNDYQGDGLQNQQQLVFDLPEINGTSASQHYDLNDLANKDEQNHTLLIEENGIHLQLYTGTLGQEKNIASYIAWFNGATSEGRDAASSVYVDPKSEVYYYIGGNNTLKVDVNKLPEDFKAHYTGNFVFNKTDEAPKVASLDIRVNNNSVSGEVKDATSGNITYFILDKGSDLNAFFFKPKDLDIKEYAPAASTPNYYNSSDSAQDAKYLNGKVKGDGWNGAYQAAQ